MNGREKCEIINRIRKKVADKNGIEFEIYDCTTEGDCTGRCEKSDMELNYLEKMLEKRQSEGKSLDLSGVFVLDIDEKAEQISLEKSLKRQEKLEELQNNPFLSDLPPRYLDNLLG